jgi:hypothetical protein
MHRGYGRRFLFCSFPDSYFERLLVEFTLEVLKCVAVGIPCAYFAQVFALKVLEGFVINFWRCRNRPGWLFACDRE